MRGRGARAFAGALVLASAAALSGCVVVPRTVVVFDEACRTHVRQVTLEVAAIGGLHSCAGDACAAMLVSAGVVAAASAVISGSIMVAGNLVYWLERQGGCPEPR